MSIYDTIFATDKNYNAAPIKYKLKIVLKWVKKNGFKNLLDVGCGRGHYLELLNKNNVNITGLEPSKNSIDTLKNYQVINDDILGQANKRRKWEALICMDVLEHIEPSKINETVGALASLANHALIGIANHSDVWRGTQLHPIQQDSSWWKALLSRYYDDPGIIYQSKRFFIFDARSSK